MDLFKITTDGYGHLFMVDCETGDTLLRIDISDYPNHAEAMKGLIDMAVDAQIITD